MRNEGGGFAEIDDEVAAVLAFVISSATFLAAQDDETGRCPKVVCKSLVTGYSSLQVLWVQRVLKVLRVQVAASPQYKERRCPRVAFQSPVTSHSNP